MPKAPCGALFRGPAGIAATAAAVPLGLPPGVGYDHCVPPWRPTRNAAKRMYERLTKAAKH